MIQVDFNRVEIIAGKLAFSFLWSFKWSLKHKTHFQTYPNWKFLQMTKVAELEFRFGKVRKHCVHFASHLMCINEFLDHWKNALSVSHELHSHFSRYFSVSVRFFTFKFPAHFIALRTWEQEVAVRSLARPIFFPWIDNSHCDRIHYSLTPVCCFNDGYVGKQPVAWKEYCVECWLKELQESLDRCNGCSNISEMLLKNGVKHHSIISYKCLITVQPVHSMHSLPVRALTLSQTTNFRPFQIQRVCRRQFQMWWKWQKVLRNG